MKVYLNSITGYEDAFTALLMSKRSWTAEKQKEIQWMVWKVTEGDGTISDDIFGQHNLTMFNEWMEKLVKWKDHITLLKFIDFSFTVEGLHRGGQDDWDAHACRYYNRIIRTSTRLATFKENEMSDWYEGKIIPAMEACKIANIELPEMIEHDGYTYVKTVNGYIREDLKEDKDVLRGLYMMSIPSNFIFNVNAAEWAHVYKLRNAETHAHPEVRQLAEEIADLLESANPYFTRDLWLSIPN